MITNPRLNIKQSLLAILLGIWITVSTVITYDQPEPFDHMYSQYENLLRAYVVGTKVNYTSLKYNRTQLDAVVDSFGGISAAELKDWSTEKQIAYWINAYNVFTLQAIVDNYPIQSSWLNWFKFIPRNSIKQISGVWNELKWLAAGSEITLDEIEHDKLRKIYKEPRIHFAINCASISCPPLNRKPYVAERLNQQLSNAVKLFLASELGLRIEGTRLQVSSIFDWYGEDFIDEYAHLIDLSRSAKERAILGVVAEHGPQKASKLARDRNANVRFLRYNWSLNETEMKP